MLEMINFPDAPNMLSLTPIAFCVTIFTAFSVYYAKVSPKFDSERKRAYLLSTLSSLTMSIISLPFVGAYLAYGIQGCFTMAQSGWMLRLGQFGVMFFGTYLFGKSFVNPARMLLISQLMYVAPDGSRYMITDIHSFRLGISSIGHKLDSSLDGSTTRQSHSLDILTFSLTIVESTSH